VMTSFIKDFSNCACAACYLITGSNEDHTNSLRSFGACSSGNYIFSGPYASVVSVCPVSPKGL
jgi:hypothetical protein